MILVDLEVQVSVVSMRVSLISVGGRGMCALVSLAGTLVSR